jgi:hypothetical protein
LKFLINYIIVLSILFQVSAKAGIFTYYLLNKSYIAQVLCINKEKKEMACDGKCYLKKQLKKEEEKETNKPVYIKLQNDVVLYFKTVNHFQANAYPLQKLNLHNDSRSTIFKGNPLDIFHPPQS